MFTNRLNLINIFIILMLGIAVSLNAIGAQFFAEVFRTMNHYGPSDTTAMLSVSSNQVNAAPGCMPGSC